VKTRAWPWLLAAGVLAAGFHELFVGGVQAARDLSGHVFPETLFLVSQWSKGEVPLWLPNARLGQPFLALIYTQVFYAPRVLTGLVFGHVLGPNVLHLLHAAWAFAGSFFAARRLGLSRAASFVAAAPFSLSPFFTEFAQNLSFASTASWAGWILWAAEGLRRAPGLRASAWLALMLGVAFHAGSPEMWLWEAMLAGFVLLRSPRSLGWGALSVAWAGALSAVVALPAAELSREYTRAGEPTVGALQWSVSWQQLLSIAVPDADLPRAGSYWGGDDQRFIFSLFVGTTAVLLAIFGASSRRARPLLALTALCLVLALGKHFVVSKLLLSFPPFSLFRYPAKYAVGALFGLSMLAGFGARRLLALVRQRRWIPIAVVAGLPLGLAASALLPNAREGLREHAWWLVVVAVSVALATGLSEPVEDGPNTRTTSRRSSTGSDRSAWLLALLVAVELVFAPVARWDRLPFGELTRPSSLAPRLQHAGRVSIRVDLDDFDHEACGPWDAERDPLLDGRDRLSALRFLEEGISATGGYGFRDPWRLQTAFGAGEGAYAAAGVSTFVRETWAPAPPGATQVEPSPIDDIWIWRAERPARRGAFFGRVSVASEAQAFEALRDPERVSRELVVEQGSPLDGPPCDAPVVTTDVDARTVEQRVVACAPGAVLLADAWYPGWRVEVDGVTAEPLRAWGFLRAVRVEAGPHTVRWRYEPRAFQFGAALSSLAALGLLVLLFPRGRRH